MAQARYKQDMPPPGGYGRINIERIPAKTLLKSPLVIGGSTIIAFVSAKYYYRRRHFLQLYNLERNDVEVSIQPFLLAERDRRLLKHLHKNYEEEKEIMKDVPGWEVCTVKAHALKHTQKVAKSSRIGCGIVVWRKNLISMTN